MKNHDKRQQEKLWMKLFQSSVQRGEQHRNLHCRALFQDTPAKTKQPWALVIFSLKGDCAGQSSERSSGPERSSVLEHIESCHSTKNRARKSTVFLGPLTCHGSNELSQKHYV